MWCMLDGHDELVLLVAYPDGDRHGGVHLRPSGLHDRGERLEGRFWVYTNAGGQGGARPIKADVRLTRQDFMKLGETALWKEHLRPVLIEESQRFDQWYLETHGSPNALSRFPQKMKTGSFVAKDANGNPVTIHVYTKYIRSKSQANLIIPGGQGLTTDDGYNVNFNVNRLEKGKYEIGPTGQVLTSDDPCAP
ncbi:MAG TPA: hypothetical protein VMP01_04000 [Pirellulaceae bacterium]|nr:hypothetical protein [Pirellulaceae bacterium]